MGELNVHAVDSVRADSHDRAASMSRQGWGSVYELLHGKPAIPDGVEWLEKPRGQASEDFVASLPHESVWRRQLGPRSRTGVLLRDGEPGLSDPHLGAPGTLFPHSGKKAPGLRDQASHAHLDPIAPEGNALGDQAPLLPAALGEGAVGADHPPPGQVRVVALEQHRPGEARRPRRDVAISAHEPGRDLAHPGKHF